MEQFFADASSKDVIRQGLELYANFDKAHKNNPNNKITDLFFIHTGKGLEFIHKKTLRDSGWLSPAPSGACLAARAIPCE